MSDIERLSIEAPWPYAELLDEYNELADKAARLTRELAEARAVIAENAKRWSMVERERSEARHKVAALTERAEQAERDRDTARQALAAARDAFEDFVAQLRDEFSGWSNETAQIMGLVRAHLASSPDGQK